MMGGPGIIGLDALQLQGFQNAGLFLHLFFEKFDELALFGGHFVQLLHLVFEVGEVGLDFFNSLGRFICHGVDFNPPSPGSRGGEITKHCSR